jgi:hypothetical protein
MISKGVLRAAGVMASAVVPTLNERKDTVMMIPRVTEVMGMGWSLMFLVISPSTESIVVEVEIGVTDQGMKGQGVLKTGIERMIDSARETGIGGETEVVIEGFNRTSTAGDGEVTD